jgi:hypothetical protein
MHNWQCAEEPAVFVPGALCPCATSNVINTARNKPRRLIKNLPDWVGRRIVRTIKRLTHVAIPIRMMPVGAIPVKFG